MSQLSTGLYKLLEQPVVYDSFQWLIGTDNVRRRLVRDLGRVSRGKRVLDIGCGTGNLLRFVPEGVTYVGMDLNADYIESARRRFGARGKFEVGDVHTFRHEDAGEFDVVLAFGLFHHVSDEVTKQVVKMAHEHLKPGGRFCTVDPVYYPKQPWLTRWVVSNDRGRNTGNEDRYRGFLTDRFGQVSTSVEDWVLRIPYTLILAESIK